MRMAEPPLQLARRLFVLGEVMAVRDGLHGLEVDARPGDMPMLFAVFLVGDDDAGLSLEAERLFGNVERFHKLRAGERIARLRAYHGMIERLLAFGAFGIGFHLFERADGILRDGAFDLDERDALVFTDALEITSQSRARAA
jgi:hypothetical protein